MLIETNPFPHGEPNRTLRLDPSESAYITDGHGTRWQVKSDAEGLVIRLSGGHRLVVLPDCANTIRVKQEP